MARKNRLLVITLCFVCTFVIFVFIQVLVTRKIRNSVVQHADLNQISVIVQKDPNILVQHVELPKEVTECDQSYGWPLVEKWRANTEVYCSTSDSETPSSLKCKQVRYSGVNDRQEQRRVATCELENAAIDFSKLILKDSRYEFADQALGGHCDVNYTKFKTANFDKNILLQLQQYPPTLFDKCSQWIDHPIYFIRRSETGNLYHALTDMFMTWVNTYVTDTKIEDWQFLIFDDKKDRPQFDYLWNAFQRKPALRVKDFTGKGKICFKRAIMAEDGFSSPLDQPVHAVNCHSSALFTAFINFLMNKLNLPKPEKRTKPTITVILRKDREGHAIMRQFKNEVEMLDALRANTSDVEINALDLADLTLEEQIKLMQRTDILFGQHGAGLANLLFLPQHAVVLEFNAVGAHYRNWATMTGRTYVSFGQERSYHRHTVPVDIDEMLQVMGTALRMARLALDRKNDCGLKCT